MPARAHDQHRTRGVLHALLADRTEQKALEATEAT
jgi:hypothetical protein